MSQEKSQINFQIFKDLLSSVHRLPPIKTSKNSYRMTADEWISNMTVLIMQLVQSVVKVNNKLLLISFVWFAVKNFHCMSLNDVRRENNKKIQKFCQLLLLGIAVCYKGCNARRKISDSDIKFN